MKRIAIVGTGLIGASVGLALKAAGFDGTVVGWDAKPDELAAALSIDAIDEALPNREALLSPDLADVYVLATPVLPILDWLQKLAPVLTEQQLVTDVGSTKFEICELAKKLYNGEGQPRFLPGHPMAGKERGGAALADAALFRDASWLFTPLAATTPLEEDWRSWVDRMGARSRDLDAKQHDELCAWVSHLPQFVATAMSALFQDTFTGTFAGDAERLAAIEAIGGRALREMTRLGAGPYSMWRDVALTNAEPVAATLLALEQRLAHLRENLRTPELRNEFLQANAFRAKK